MGSNEETIRADVAATVARLQGKHPDLKQAFEKCHGYAVLPSVGRAGAVLGGAYGKGEVFERGESIGFASLSQMTIGVQVGGQTFSDLILFPKKEALDKFRDGEVAFTANASAVIVKAAASGTTNFDAVTAHAFSRGGMLLELSLGGQKFTFIPPEKLEAAAEKAAEKGKRKAEKAQAKAEAASAEKESGAGAGGQEEAGKGDERVGHAVQSLAKRIRHDGGIPRRLTSRLPGGAASMGRLLREHRVAGSLVGAGMTGLAITATAVMARR